MLKFKTMYLMRGLPGSGKSTIAESLTGGQVSYVEKAIGDDIFRYKLGPNGLVCTTDAYFYDTWSPDGNYIYDPNLIYKNHLRNQSCAELAMMHHTPIVVIDNVNAKKPDFKHYLNLCSKYGYKTVIVEAPHTSVEDCAKNNKHGVSEEVIRKMEESFYYGKIEGTRGEKYE